MPKKITIRWSRRENDWMFDWPAGLKATASYLNGILGRSEVLPARGALRAYPVGGILSKEVLEELDRRGVDIKGIKIVLPLKERETSVEPGK